MLRSIIPRLPVIRALAPRFTPPILPLVRIRPLVASQQQRFRLFHPSPPRSLHDEASSTQHSLPSDATISQRLKHLIKSYGWYALGVYLVLSAIDFGVAFAGVNLLGAEYVSHVAFNVKQSISNLINSRPSEPGRDEIDTGSSRPGQEGLYAMLVLAYTIHKTLFLPLRFGLTAALTPKLVAWLTRRGWTGGSGARRAAAEMKERIRGRNN
ncbi:hypothetical protein H0H93_010231 [Arthromyces matolae]|nr:hypothetical protein H0H93_010231 [Arthromyces matolae]